MNYSFKQLCCPLSLRAGRAKRGFCKHFHVSSQIVASYISGHHQQPDNDGLKRFISDAKNLEFGPDNATKSSNVAAESMKILRHCYCEVTGYERKPHIIIPPSIIGYENTDTQQLHVAYWIRPKAVARNQSILSV